MGGWWVGARGVVWFVRGVCGGGGGSALADRETSGRSGDRTESGGGGQILISQRCMACVVAIWLAREAKVEGPQTVSLSFLGCKAVK